MNIILPDQHGGNVDIDLINNRFKLLADNPALNLALAKKNLRRYYGNGLSQYADKVRLSVITNLAECKKIWDQFSPNENIFDLWDFRMAFHKSYGGKPYFIILTRNSQILACLPLFYETTIKKFTWFGSDWQENTSFFAADPLFIPIMLYFAPKPLILEGINQTAAKRLPDFIKLEKDEPNFHLKLDQFDGMSDFLQSLTKKRRYNLKRDYERIAQLEPTIVTNNLDHFDDMITITKKRFYDKGEQPDFEKDPYIEGTFYNLLHANSSQFTIKLQSVMINGQIAATDMLAFHNDIVYPLRGGNNVSRFSGIGNYINYHEIEQAFNDGLKKVDFLEYAYGWKQNYLASEPRFKLVLND